MKKERNQDFADLKKSMWQKFITICGRIMQTKTNTFGILV